MNLFELFVKIGVDDQASGKLKTISDKLGNGLKTAAKVGTAAVATVTAAATAMTTAFIKGTSEVAQYGDNIDKMSQKMGISAEAYQEWDFIMQHSGTSMEALKAGMKTLANAVENGNDAFERLGITQEEIASMNQEELFAKTIEGLQGVSNETERTYLAGQLLGRGATELGALLNTSAEDVEAMRQQVHDLGGVMSDEAVKAAAAYQDSLQNMQTAFSGIQRGMLSEFLPSMVTVMDGLALIFSGNDSGIAKITEGVNQFTDKLMEAVPKIFELGEGILSSLATSILDNLPTLTSTATNVIIKLVAAIVSALPILAESSIEIISSLTQGLSDNLPTIIESAVELISTLADGILEMLPEIVKLGLDLLVSLANGISENLPELIPTIVDVVIHIVETLIDNVDMLIDAAIAIIIALADGLFNSLPTLIEEIPGLVIKIVEEIIENAPKLLDAAAEIIAKLTSGLIEGFVGIAINIGVWLYDNIVQPIIDKVSDFKDAGKQLLEGLWNGISDKVSWLKGKVSGVVDTIKGWFTGKDGFDEHSPSKWSKQVFRYVMEGGGEGLDAGLPGLMQNVGFVTDKVKSGLDFGTASVDFGSSGLGISSAGIINASNIGSAGEQLPREFNLVLPDGTLLASYLLKPLADYARANGTPILNPI